MKKTVTIHLDKLELACKFLDAEQKATLLDIIIQYQNNNVIFDITHYNKNNTDKVLLIAIEMVIQSIDHNNEQYEKAIQKKSKAGKKGMENRWKTSVESVDNAEENNTDNTVISVITQDNTVIPVITDDNKHNHTVTDTDTVTDIHIKENIKENNLPTALTEQKQLVEKVVEYLNTKTGKKYSAKSKNAVKHIYARLKEDSYSLQDFKTVIDVKVRQWKDDNKMQSYLRPSTLFGAKFIDYLNEHIEPSKPANTCESRRLTPEEARQRVKDGFMQGGVK